MPSRTGGAGTLSRDACWVRFALCAAGQAYSSPSMATKTVLITGVTRGLGRAMMDEFARHVASNGLAPFSALEAVVGPVGALAHDAEFARFHACNLGDVLEE